MRLDEAPEIALCPLAAVLALVGVCAGGVVVGGILPRFPGQGLDGGVEGREDGGVGVEVAEE